MAESIHPLYKEIRGLSRGILVLKTLNQQPGGLGSIAELSRSTGIHRTTVKRVLETLRGQGLVYLTEREGQYQLTFEVQRLSEGYRAQGWISEAAHPLMLEAAPLLVWPTNLATPDAGSMVVRESTHRNSLVSQHRAMIGVRAPLLTTSIGRAFFVACSESEREALLTLLAHGAHPHAMLACDRAYVDRLVDETTRRGYAINCGEWAAQSSFSGIALPVKAGELMLGAINLVFPVNALGRKQLEERFVPALRLLAQQIGSRSVRYVF